MSRFARQMLALFAAGTVAVTASAHHSFAQFDSTRTIDLSGTFRALEWQNPHSWIWVDVPMPDGSVSTWGGEFGGGPTQLPREGFTRTSVQPGDKIVLTLFPARDGSKAGSVSKLQLADGKVLTFMRPQGPPTATPAPASN